MLGQRTDTNVIGSRPEYLVSAVFRAAGEAFEPEPLLTHLGRRPDRVWRRGRVDRRGRTQATSGFSLSVVEAGSAAALQEALTHFVTSQVEFLRAIHKAGGACEVDFGLMVGPEGTISFHLDAALLALLAAEGIAVHVTGYPCTDDDQE